MNPRILIMGIGNWLMSDDGVGVQAAQLLARDPPPGVLVVDAGTDALSALSYLEQASRVLLIDAVRGGDAPGTIRSYSESELASNPGSSLTHAVNVFASRHLFPAEAVWPEFLILGVEPAVLDYGLNLSPVVAAKLPQIARRCREIVADWNRENLHA